MRQLEKGFTQSVSQNSDLSGNEKETVFETIDSESSYLFVSLIRKTLQTYQLEYMNIKV